MNRKFSIAVSLAVLSAMIFTTLALADVPAHIFFTTDLPCAVTVEVISYTDPLDPTLIKSATLTTPSTLDTFPLSPVTFFYQGVVVCNGVTYHLQFVSPSGPLTSGAAGTTITVTGHYIDTEAPTLHLPANMTLEATSVSGAVVTYTATADDTNPDHPVVTCAPASGATLGFGTTTVNCAATDAAGNTANGSFTVTVQDTMPPTVTTPANMTVEAENASGAVVAYSGVSASDAVDGPLTATCVPASGSTFSLGTTTVTCTATDAHANTGTASFSVTVVETTPPTLTLPANMTVNATDASGAVVTFTTSATDLVDGSVPVTCVPVSGSTFPIGITTVNCAATDSHANTASGSFTITVAVDTTPPVWDVPTDFSMEATGPAGAVVTYTASVSDPDDPVSTQSCSPASGSTFPLGITTVHCTATDTHGNVGAAQFEVTVVDTTPPSVNVPGNMVVEATSAAGAAVNFSASANDLVDGAIIPTCIPASGSTFPLGTTQVTCSAADTHGNAANATFNVTVGDTTPPVLNLPGEIAIPASSESGARVNFTVSATDAVDGVVAVNCSPASGSRFPIGETTVNCSASDSHGNAESGSFSVAIQYAAAGVKCSGIAGHEILHPISPDGSSVFEQGSVVPAKFRVCAMNGVAITSPDVVTDFTLLNSDLPILSSTPETDFRAGNNQWIFNIDTSNLAADSTYIYLITLNDGSSIEFQFELK